jgi:hypothetical protein
MAFLPVWQVFSQIMSLDSFSLLILAATLSKLFGLKPKVL